MSNDSSAPARSDDAVYAFVKAFLVDEFEVPEDIIERTSGLEDLDLDSIDAVDLAIAVEGRYGLKFTNDDMEGFACLQDVVDTIVGAPPERFLASGDTAEAPSALDG